MIYIYIYIPEIIWYRIDLSSLCDIALIFLVRAYTLSNRLPRMERLPLSQDPNWWKRH